MNANLDGEFRPFETDANRIDTDFNLMVSRVTSDKQNKCKQWTDAALKWLIDYANSKVKVEEYYEIIESVEGVSHLDASNFEELKIDDDFILNSDKLDNSKDSLYDKGKLFILTLSR